MRPRLTPTVTQAGTGEVLVLWLPTPPSLGSLQFWFTVVATYVQL